MTVLRAARKADRIVAAVRLQIGTGQLRAGERLASVTALQRHYRVSQRVVVDAIAALAKAGLIETRPRSGCYVKGTGAAAAPVGATFPRQTTVTIATLEKLPENLAIWNRILEAYRARHPHTTVRLQMGPPEHHPGPSANAAPDVVLTIPGALLQAGMTAWANCEDLSAVGLGGNVLHPLLLTARGSHTALIPFALSLSCLYVNLDLLAEATATETPVKDWQQLFARAQQVEEATPTGVHGLVSYCMRDWLLVSGALRFVEGCLHFRPEVALELCTRYQQMTMVHVEASEAMSLFLAGRLAFLHHSTFTAIEIRRQKKFRWAAWPLPVAPGASIPVEWAAFAVNRQTACPQECLGLIRDFCSQAAQLAFARVGGNLPVRQDVLNSPEFTQSQPADLPPAAALLAYSSAAIPPSLAARLIHSSAFEADLATGRITPAEAVSRLRFALSLLPEYTPPS